MAEEQKKNKIEPSIPKPTDEMVKTYAEDVAETIVTGDQVGMIKKIIQDEHKREKESINLSPESRLNKVFLIASIFLLAVSLGTIFYFFPGGGVNVVPVEMPFTPMIFNDETEFIAIEDLTKGKMAEVVSNEAENTTVKEGGIEGIYLTIDKKIIGLRKFIGLIESTLVLESTDFVDDNFLLGLMNGGGGDGAKSLFFLLKMRSVADIFESMRKWENKMFYDIHGFLGVDLTSETRYLVTKNFEDDIVENKNARILYKKDGSIAMMYIFVDDMHLVIANDEVAVREVIIRLAGSRVKQ